MNLPTTQSDIVGTPPRRRKKRKSRLAFLESITASLVGVILLVQIVGFFHIHMTLSLPSPTYEESSSTLGNETVSPEMQRIQREISGRAASCPATGQGIADTSSWKPFGILEVLNRTYPIPQTAHGLQAPSMMRALRFHSHARERSCRLPEATAHSASSYARIVYSKASNLRLLFLNLLQWLIDPAMDECWVILPSEDLVKNDTAYGKRLLAWDRQPKHPVRLVYSDTITGGIPTIDVRSKVSSIVWENGDVPRRRTKHDTQVALELWKGDSATVFTPVGWRLDHTDPVCGPRDLRGFVDTNTTVGALSSLHDVVHHRDYLCFLKHPAIQSALTRESLSLDEESLTLSAWLLQVSPGHQARQLPTTSPSPSPPVLTDRMKTLLLYLGGPWG